MVSDRNWRQFCFWIVVKYIDKKVHRSLVWSSVKYPQNVFFICINIIEVNTHANITSNLEVLLRSPYIYPFPHLQKQLLYRLWHQRDKRCSWFSNILCFEENLLCQAPFTKHCICEIHPCGWIHSLQNFNTVQYSIIQMYHNLLIYLLLMGICAVCSSSHCK